MTDRTMHRSMLRVDQYAYRMDTKDVFGTLVAHLRAGVLNSGMVFSEGSVIIHTEWLADAQEHILLVATWTERKDGDDATE